MDSEQRPKTFDDFVGQKNAVDQLKIAVRSAALRNAVIDHILLAGPAGLGKTTIAQIIANTLGTRCIEMIATSIKSADDLLPQLVALNRGDVLFIDEVHDMSPRVQEHLYTVMEDYKILRVAKRTGRAVTIHLNKFVLIGATTIEGRLTGPLLSRFGMVVNLQPYTDAELVQIVKRAATKESVKIDDAAAAIIADRCRATPRIALRHLRRVRDAAVIAGDATTIKACHAVTAYTTLKIIEFGLTDQDKEILRVLKQDGGPVGLQAMSALSNVEIDTVQYVVEPHLMRLGFIQRTRTGRTITDKGVMVYEKYCS